MPERTRSLQRCLPSGGRRRRLQGVLLVVLWLALGCAPAEGGESDQPLREVLALVSGEGVGAHAKALDAIAPADRGADRFAWLETRFEAAGLVPRGAAGSWALRDARVARTHAVLAAIPGSDPLLTHEGVLLCAPIDDVACVAVLTHLAEVLAKSKMRLRRPIIFCGLVAGDGAAAAVAAHLGTLLGAEGCVVGALVLAELGGSGGPPEIRGVRTYPVVRDHVARLLPTSDAEHQTRLVRNGAPKGTATSLRERGIPAFSVTDAPPAEGAVRHVGQPAMALATRLEPAARLVARLGVGLAGHPEPLRDPLGVASYLVRARPRFSVDDLAQESETSFKLKRAGRYPLRVDSGLSAVIVNVAEDLDPRAAWQALVALEAQEGAVRYLVMRRTADIERAFTAGAIALVPRLCCARGAHGDPTYLAAAAAIGYRWIAPWSTGTRRTHDACLVAPLVAAARLLPVILDAGDLPPAQHKSLRRVLRDRPALFLNLTSPDARGPALGARTLPLTRFRRTSTWQSALDYPGMAAPVVYRPKGGQLAAAIAAWGAQQQPGWDAPGSVQREGLRAALGGALIAWLAEAER